MDILGKIIKNERGTTLVRLLTASAVLSIVIPAVSGSFSNLQNGYFLLMHRADLNGEKKSIGLFLSKTFDGRRNISNLSFRPPSSAVARPICRNTSFCVIPDRDFNQSRSTGNDVIYTVVRVPTSSQGIFLTSSFPGNNLGMRSSDGATSLRAIFSVGDFLVLSNIQQAGLIRVTDTPPHAYTTNNFPLNNSSYDVSELVSTSPARIRGNFMAEDFVYKAKMEYIGLDPNTKELKIESFQSPSPQITTIGRDVTQFTVSYDLRPAVGNECLGIATPPDTWGRDWASINSDPMCYERIQSVKFEYVVEAKSPSGDSLGVQKGEYEYFR